MLAAPNLLPEVHVFHNVAHARIFLQAYLPSKGEKNKLNKSYTLICKTQ